MTDLKYPIKTVYWTDEEEAIVQQVRELLIMLDKLKYGQGYVKRELDKGKKSKYIPGKIIRYIIREGGKMLVKRLSDEIEKEKLKKEKEKRKRQNEQQDPLSRLVTDLSARANNNWQQVMYK